MILVLVGGNKAHCFLQFLALNNNPLEDFPWRFFFCHEVNQLLEYKNGQGAQDPLNSNSIIRSMSIFRNIFFSSILCVKTGEVEVNRY